MTLLGSSVHKLIDVYYAHQPIHPSIWLVLVLILAHFYSKKKNLAQHATSFFRENALGLA
jgi:hypothetical protein